jgi:hypothetical protein
VPRAHRQDGCDMAQRLDGELLIDPAHHRASGGSRYSPTASQIFASRAC